MGRGAATGRGERKGDFLAGKYLLEDCLGIGGMGEVYRATNVSLGRQVAIKLLSSEYVHIEEDVLRFLREARAAAAVRHSNVVDVLDVARDDDGTPFIVQELLAGEDLERYLRTRNGRLSCEEALEIMIPVADAVAAAHAQHVVHRDLKPANIFLARDRNKITPKVLDFGACLFPTIAERSAKEVRMLIGTPHYMAPEQIVSKQDVDARTDVWALGVILWEMIVGESPFEAETTNDVLRLVKTRDVPLIRERVREAPKELEELVARCTKRDRLSRHADAGTVHENMLEVRRRMRGAPSSSRAETLAELPAQRVPLGGSRRDPASPAPAPVSSRGRQPRVPSLDEPAAFEVPSLDDLDTPAAFARGSSKMTLSSPDSEPPPSLDDLDIPLPTAPHEAMSKNAHAAPPLAIAMPPLRSAGSRLDGVGSNGVDDDDDDDGDAGPVGSLELAARPSSWPPTARPAVDALRSTTESSMPPVLDPRAVKKVPSPIPAPPLPREVSSEEEAPISRANPGADARPKPRPPAVIASNVTPVRANQAPEWTTFETVKFVAIVALPAIVGFIAVLVVPVLGTPVGRALRGDSPLASGVLAVVALIAAAALCARSMLGEKSRWLYVAAAGSVLFGIVMIIVTFAASEAAELGVPMSMAGVSTAVAPIAPLVLGLAALSNARATWVDPYSRAEAVRSAALASLMLFLMLALSPVGVVRTPARPPQALRGLIGR